MVGRERPVLVAIITTMGIIIAALITSGYFKLSTTAKREDLLEARIRQLESDLEKCRRAAPVINGTGNQTNTEIAIDKRESQRVVDLHKAADKLLVSRPGSQLLPVNVAATGVLAANAVKEYVFVGTANEPILFELDQPREHFSAKIEILGSGGATFVRDENFHGSEKKLSFTPIKTDAYLLRLRGTRKFGAFTVLMSGLAGAER